MSLAPAALILLLGITGVEGESFQLTVDGSARAFLLFQRQYETVVTPAETQGLAVARVRTDIRLRFRESFRAELAYDVVPSIGTQAGEIQELAVSSGAPLRLWDLHDPIDRSFQYQLHQNLDRAFVHWTLPFADVRVGRQAMSHGTARLIGATDIFGAFSPASLDNEYKRGVDAARITIPWGERAELELVGVGHEDDMASGIYLAHWTGSFPGFDISAYTGASYQRPTLGIDISGQLGGTAVYTEWGLRIGEADDARIRATGGMHHRFEFGMTLVVEGHVSTVGRRHARDYLLIVDEPEFQNGEMFLLGQFYGAAAVTYELTPLLNVGVLWIQNVTDGSALVSPSLDWNFGQNTQIGLGAILGAGKRPHVSLVPPGVTLRSEFGAAPSLFFSEVRVYY